MREINRRFLSEAAKTGMGIGWKAGCGMIELPEIEPGLLLRYPHKFRHICHP